MSQLIGLLTVIFMSTLSYANSSNHVDKISSSTGLPKLTIVVNEATTLYPKELSPEAYADIMKHLKQFYKFKPLNIVGEYNFENISQGIPLLLIEALPNEPKRFYELTWDVIFPDFNFIYETDFVLMLIEFFHDKDDEFPELVSFFSIMRQLILANNTEIQEYEANQLAQLLDPANANSTPHDVDNNQDNDQHDVDHDNDMSVDTNEQIISENIDSRHTMLTNDQHNAVTTTTQDTVKEDGENIVEAEVEAAMEETTAVATDPYATVEIHMDSRFHISQLTVDQSVELLHQLRHLTAYDHHADEHQHVNLAATEDYGVTYNHVGHEILYDVESSEDVVIISTHYLGVYDEDGVQQVSTDILKLPAQELYDALQSFDMTSLPSSIPSASMTLNFYASIFQLLEYHLAEAYQQPTSTDTTLLSSIIEQPTKEEEEEEVEEKTMVIDEPTHHEEVAIEAEADITGSENVMTVEIGDQLEPSNSELIREYPRLNTASTTPTTSTTPSSSTAMEMEIEKEEEEEETQPQSIKLICEWLPEEG